MKKITSIIFLLAICTGAWAQKQFVIDPNAEARVLTGSFNKIKIHGSIDLYLSQAEVEAVAVSASDSKYIADIKTEVKNNTLYIHYTGSWNWSGKNRKLKVYASFRNIEQIEAAGASDVMIAGVIKVPELTIGISGASDLTGELEVDNLHIDASGASDAKLSGRAKNLDAECSGASDIKAYELTTENCKLQASGASDIYITVSNELKGKASGASSIYYKGQPQVKDVESSGASTVASRNR
ncbi:MAG: head GIN domain-containing protein [Ferruginibacter sp.]